jgi:hypothetical protein
MYIYPELHEKAGHLPRTSPCNYFDESGTAIVEMKETPLQKREAHGRKKLHTREKQNELGSENKVGSASLPTLLAAMESKAKQVRAIKSTRQQANETNGRAREPAESRSTFQKYEQYKEKTIPSNQPSESFHTCLTSLAISSQTTRAVSRPELIRLMECPRHTSTPGLAHNTHATMQALAVCKQQRQNRAVSSGVIILHWTVGMRPKSASI